MYQTYVYMQMSDLYKYILLIDLESSSFLIIKLYFPAKV